MQEDCCGRMLVVVEIVAQNDDKFQSVENVLLSLTMPANRKDLDGILVIDMADQYLPIEVSTWATVVLCVSGGDWFTNCTVLVDFHLQ